MTRDGETAYKFLTEKPAQFGHMLGYPDLRDTLHGDWIRKMVLGHEDFTIQAHRGSYKTTCVCIALAITIMLRGDLNSIFLRKTDTDVKEVLTNIDRILRAPVSQEIFRAITGQQLNILHATNTEITASTYAAPKGAAQLLGMGINGSITGKHADRIWTDDIVNLKDRQSTAERDQTKRIYQELQNIRNRGGRIINTGTPWHKEDAFSLMPQPLKYDCYSTGLLTKEGVDRLRKSMTPSLFAANYELRHIASENALFETPPVFHEYEKDKEGNDINPLKNGIFHIDAAYGGDDWTAVTCGKRVGDKIYMYGNMWHTHVDTVLDNIIALADKYKCAPIYCENNGDKGFLAKEVRRKNPNMPVRIYHEKENKYIKISTYLRKWWQDIIWLPETGKEYLAQIQDYTEEAEHDDAPDSAACVARILDRPILTEYKPILEW